MDAEAQIARLAYRARLAARTLSMASSHERKAALLAIADEIESRSVEILKANEEDMARGRAEGMHPQLLDRLLLTPERIAAIVDGARQVANLPDPLEIILRESTLPNGLHLKQITVPFWCSWHSLRSKAQCHRRCRCHSSDVGQCCIIARLIECVL